MEEVLEKKGVFSELKRDKLLLSLVIIILVLGVYVRFSHYGEESYWNDDMTTVPTGLLWFYPHNTYPGLAGQGEPALGNYFIGLGCISSGEDFSSVTKISPMFYPGREILLGEAMTKADRQCHLPMFIFGILFFVAICILALIFLDLYSATYVISFFAFFPFLLYLSRWIHVDIIAHTFLAFGLIFLWFFYNSKKYSFKETVLFSIALVFFSLAFSTKFPMAAFLIFAVFILLEKYRTESLGLLKMVFVKFELKQLAEKINVISVNYKALFKNLVIGGVFYIAALLPPFEFSLKNLWFVYTKYKQVYPEISGLLKFNREFFYVIYDFIRNINVLDLLLFFFSIFIIFKLFFKRGKSLKEKFIFYLGIFAFLCLILFPSLSLLRVFFGFMIGLVFLMSFAFSNESYSIFTISKVKFKRAFFIIFIIIYIAYSFYNAYSTSPYFHYVNDIVCFADSYKCEAYKSAGISYYSASVLVSYLTPLLKEGETFYGINPIIHFYIKRSQHLLSWQFETAFKEQTGHDPDVFERVKYFHPNNESIRYIFVSPYYANLGKDTDTFKIRYEPNDIIRLKGLDIYYVYDMKNLRER